MEFLSFVYPALMLARRLPTECSERENNSKSIKNLALDSTSSPSHSPHVTVKKKKKKKKKMLGRVRASPISSLELLETERPSSKISKHDSLSIYESTLLKLKRGSQCCQSSSLEASATTNSHSAIATHPPDEVMSDADCSSAESSPNLSGISQSASTSNEKQSTNMSIHYMFSNYKLSKHAESSRDTKDMNIESCHSSSSSYLSPTSNGS